MSIRLERNPSAVTSSAVSDQPATPWKRLQAWLSNTANVLTVGTVFGGFSVTALVAYLRDSRRLATVSLVFAGVSATVLIIRALPPVFLWLRYRIDSSKTTVELIGGHSLTLVIQHKGLPVKVRARATFMEFGDEMEMHPAPYDLQLFTRVHGGRFDLIELNPSFDMAKSIFGELRKLDKDAAQFTVDRPGMTPFVAIAHRSSLELPTVLAHLHITVTVISPPGARDILRRYRLFVRHDSISVIDDTEPKPKRKPKSERRPKA
jgi:hypothetical protein